MATQTLKQALYLVRSGKSKNLGYAAHRVHGLAAFGSLCASDGGLLGQAYRDIEGLLPGNRAYTTDEWIEAVYERVEIQKDCADEYRTRAGITEPTHDPIYDLD